MSTDRYKIGEFTLDVSRGCLRRDGIDVPLRMLALVALVLWKQELQLVPFGSKRGSQRE